MSTVDDLIKEDDQRKLDKYVTKIGRQINNKIIDLQKQLKLTQDFKNTLGDTYSTGNIDEVKNAENDYYIAVGKITGEYRINVDIESIAHPMCRSFLAKGRKFPGLDN